MSSMDKAFIRAFTKEDRGEHSAPAPPQQVAAKTGSTVQTTVVDGQIQRVEAPSEDDMSHYQTNPHVEFGKSPMGMGDNQIVGPPAWSDEPIMAIGDYAALPESPSEPPPAPAPWTSVKSSEEGDDDQLAEEGMFAQSLNGPHYEWPYGAEPDGAESEQDTAERDSSSSPSSPPLVDALPPAYPVEQSEQSLDSAGSETDEQPENDEDTPDPNAFAPVWEVDQFVWPTICDALDESVKEHFLQAGDKLFAASQEGLNVLGITSRIRGEGRSTVALCLARAAASHGARVALLDADVAKPDLGSLLGLESTCTWHDYLLGRLPVAEVGIAGVEDGVTLFPMSRSAAEEKIDLRLPSATEKIREIESLFDLVLIDSGPLNAEPEHFFDGECIDAVVFVRDLRHTSAGQTSECVGRIHERDVEAVGIVENFNRLA